MMCKEAQGVLHEGRSGTTVALRYGCNRCVHGSEKATRQMAAHTWKLKKVIFGVWGKSKNILQETMP